MLRPISQGLIDTFSGIASLFRYPVRFIALPADRVFQRQLREKVSQTLDSSHNGKL